MSAAEESSSICEFYLDPHEIASGNTGDLYVNDLGDHLNEVLNIRSDNDKTGNALKVDDSKDSSEIELGNFISEKCFSKCATFPCSQNGLNTLSAVIFDVNDGRKVGLATEESAQSGYTKSANSPYSRSISLPTPLKLVSSMKGSREKSGAAPRKLTVSWAPDVYDPPPTALSHVLNSKPQRHRNDSRKTGKNKQKGGGKASRGIKGKDKMQSRKHSGSSNRALKSLDNDGKVACSDGPQVSTVDFDVGSPDPFCGHSFLKKSVAQIHFPVAEAT